MLLKVLAYIVLVLLITDLSAGIWLKFRSIRRLDRLRGQMTELADLLSHDDNGPDLLNKVPRR